MTTNELPSRPMSADATGVNRGRTDIHRPTVFDPDAYDFGWMGTWSSDEEMTYIRREAAAARKRAEAEGFRIARHQHTGQCGHCGARLMHYAAMIHRDSKEFIYVGETCLDNRFEMATAEFQAWRKARAGRRARDAKRERIANILTNHPLLLELPAPVSDGSFLSSLACQLHDRGELSEKQIAAAERAITRDKERAAQKAAEAEAKKGLPAMTAGRRTVSGTIVSKKWVTNDYSYSGGSTAKIVIEDAEGYRYYGTLPSSVCDKEKGDAISLTITVQPKGDDDPHFGFFKRPTVA